MYIIPLVDALTRVSSSFAQYLKHYKSTYMNINDLKNLNS
jgi:hypothetical protein